METPAPPDSETPTSPAAGSGSLGRFALGPCIRTHALGDTYRAQDKESGSTVALTVLHGDVDQDAAGRLHDGVRRATSLGHKSIALIYSSGSADGKLFVVSEDVAGDTLRGLLDRKRETQRFYSSTGACNIALHVLAALEHAHGSLAHGALCPSTIVITPDGRVKLTEFGLGALGSSERARSAPSRDSAYLAPETDPTAAPGPSADLFAVGALLQELLTGDPPSISNAQSAALPKDIFAIVSKCLNPDPQDRPADARALKEELLALVSTAPKGSAATGPTPPPSLPPPTPSGGMPVAPRPPRLPTPVVGVPRVPTPVLGVPRASSTMPRPLTPVAGIPLLPKGPPTGRSASFAVAAAGGPVDETVEKWLVHKDRLDFGPFSLSSVKQQILEGKFSAETIIVDQSTGHRKAIGDHPVLAPVLREAAAEVEKRRREAADHAHKVAERRTRVLVAAVVSGVVLVLVAAVLAVVQRRKPTVLEKVVYREKEQNLEGLLKGIDIAWKTQEPAKKRARKAPGAPGAPGEAPDEFDAPMELGDASQGGGDEQLSPDQIQKVMRQNFGRLTPCVLEEKRRDASLSEVQIEFLVKGSGKVAAVRTNGQKAGPLADCMLAKMKAIDFPAFNGPQTRAGFSMSLR